MLKHFRRSEIGGYNQSHKGQNIQKLMPSGPNQVLRHLLLNTLEQLPPKYFTQLIRWRKLQFKINTFGFQTCSQPQAVLMQFIF